MIINPIICKKCKHGLQPDKLGVKFKGDKLIRVCGFCGDEVEVGEKTTETEEAERQEKFCN